MQDAASGARQVSDVGGRLPAVLFETQRQLCVDRLEAWIPRTVQERSRREQEDCTGSSSGCKAYTMWAIGTQADGSDESHERAPSRVVHARLSCVAETSHGRLRKAVARRV